MSWSPAPAAHANSPAQMRAPARNRAGLDAPVRRALVFPALATLARRVQGLIEPQCPCEEGSEGPCTGCPCGPGTDQPCSGPALPEFFDGACNREPCKQATRNKTGLQQPCNDQSHGLASLRVSLTRPEVPLQGVMLHSILEPSLQPCFERLTAISLYSWEAWLWLYVLEAWVTV